MLPRLTDCPNLIYAIIRSHQQFAKLANFTLASGVASIRRTRKEQNLNATKDGTISPAKTPRRLSIASERSSMPMSPPGLTAGADTERDQEKAALMDQRPQRDDQRQPLQQFAMSPISEYPPSRLSEKAAGKLRARSSSQLTLQSNGSYTGDDLDTSISDLEASPFVSRNGFEPTENWVASWREGLPIDPILILVSECLPKVSSLASLSTNTAAIEYLRSATLVGLLPPSSPLKPRKFTHSTHSTVWLTSLVWGSVYVQSLETFWVWRDTNVRLFFVKEKEAGGVQAAVSNLVGQGLGMLNLRGGSGQVSPTNLRRTLARYPTSPSNSVIGGVV